MPVRAGTPFQQSRRVSLVIKPCSAYGSQAKASYFADGAHELPALTAPTPPTLLIHTPADDIAAHAAGAADMMPSPKRPLVGHARVPRRSPSMHA